MGIDVRKFRVKEGEKVRLKEWKTKVKAFYDSKDEYKEMLDKSREDLSDMQELLYAHDRYSLLLVFQAPDAAGKDGAIRHVMSGVNPQGCQVYGFKRPSAEDLDHDFLWRTTRSLPERGRIGIFNRSYYEEVLVVRVHPEILEKQALPAEVMKPGHDKVFAQRYKSINDLEKHLHRNGTRVVQFYLHLSKDEQKARFLARIDDPKKHWKFNLGDLEERKHWKTYMEAYENAISATSTDEAPWYIVPADDKENARLIISTVVVQTLENLDMSWPESTATPKELKAIRRQLAKDQVGVSAP
jgi:PPK2 family polyphosphate:nucleotide phosphotransferase